MSIPLDSVPIRQKSGSFSALSGVPYPELVNLYQEMQHQDSRVVFDSLRPMGDEVWNFVNDERTVQEICEAVCLEFEFRFDPTLLVKLIEGMADHGLISVKQ